MRCRRERVREIESKAQGQKASIVGKVSNEDKRGSDRIAKGVKGRDGKNEFQSVR